ncbi:hypothetical protein SUDANB178_06469 [Streptomyces sp. enrichment culture]
MNAVITAWASSAFHLRSTRPEEVSRRSRMTRVFPNRRRPSRRFPPHSRQLARAGSSQGHEPASTAVHAVISHRHPGDDRSPSASRTGPHLLFLKLYEPRGAMSVQNRLPLQDEVFVPRYGIGAAAGLLRGARPGAPEHRSPPDGRRRPHRLRSREYEGIDEVMPPVTPERSPVAHFGGTRPRRKPGSGAPARPNCWARPSPSPNSTRRGGPATAWVRRTTARSSHLLLPLTRRHPRPRRRLRPDRHRRTRRRLTRRVARLAARACHGGPVAGAGFWLRTGGVGCRTRTRQRTGQAQTAAQRATHWVTRRRRRGTAG